MRSRLRRPLACLVAAAVVSVVVADAPPSSAEASGRCASAGSASAGDARGAEEDADSCLLREADSGEGSAFDDGGDQALELLQRRGALRAAQVAVAEAALPAEDQRVASSSASVGVSPPSASSAALRPASSPSGDAGSAASPPSSALAFGEAAPADDEEAQRLLRLDERGRGGADVGDSDSARRAAQKRARWFEMLGHFRKLLWACEPLWGGAEDCADAIVGGASDVFTTFVTTWSGAASLSWDELNAFRNRFKGALSQETKAVFGKKFAWDRFSAWRSVIAKVFTDQRPAVSRALVDFVNQRSPELGWRAEYRPEMLHESVSHSRNRLGLELTDDEKNEMEQDAKGDRSEDIALLSASNASLGSSMFEGPYDVWTHWPECEDVMRHVRFQTCPNCWSHSTALITESRICIMLGGGFGGRDAWLSQSYIATCRLDSRYYCDAGSGTLGFKTVTQWGVPTGASDSMGNADPQAKTCYPQIPSDLNYAACPSACAQQEYYPRDLSHDTFFLRYSGSRPLHPSSSLTQLLAKRALLEEGPIMIGFRAYQDLNAYVDGIYRPSLSPDNLSLGGHAVTAMGFGPGYFVCTNSWGPSWGQRGTFKIATEAINIGYYLPGHAMYGKYGRFPIPIP